MRSSRFPGTVSLLSSKGFLFLAFRLPVERKSCTFPSVRVVLLQLRRHDVAPRKFLPDSGHSFFPGYHPLPGSLDRLRLSQTNTNIITFALLVAWPW